MLDWHLNFSEQCLVYFLYFNVKELNKLYFTCVAIVILVAVVSRLTCLLS